MSEAAEIQFIVRALQPDADIAPLRAFLSPEEGARLAQILPAVMDDDAYLLIALVQGQAAGWAVVHTRFRTDLNWHEDGDAVALQSGRNGYLEHLAVTPAHRSRGIGKALLAAAEAEALRRGKSALWLHTGEANVRAQSFYIREGWQYQRTVHPVWNDGSPMRIYCKDLR